MQKILILSDGEKAAKVFENFMNENGFSTSCEKYEVLSDIDYNAGYNAAVCFGKNAKNIEKAVKFTENAKIGRLVYVGSVLTYFDRKYPERNLKKHAVIADYSECEKIAISAVSENLDVSVAEMPPMSDEIPDGIFTVDGVPAVESKKFVLTFDGGFVRISAENYAAGVASVLVNGRNGVSYPFCDGIVKYKDALKEKKDLNKKIYEYPEELWWILAVKASRKLKKEGKKPSFDVKTLYKENLFENFFFDPVEVKKQLGYE